MLVVIDLEVGIPPSLAAVLKVVLLHETGFASGLRTGPRGYQLAGRASGELAHDVEVEPEATR